MCYLSGHPDNFFLHSAQMEPWVQIPLVSQPITAPSIHHTRGQVGPLWTCRIIQGMSCGEAATISHLGLLLRCCLSKCQQRQPPPTSSPVKAGLDPVLQCHMDSAGLKPLLSHEWGLCKAVMRNLATT